MRGSGESGEESGRGAPSRCGDRSLEDTRETGTRFPLLFGPNPNRPGPRDVDIGVIRPSVAGRRIRTPVVDDDPSVDVAFSLEQQHAFGLFAKSR